MIRLAESKESTKNTYPPELLHYNSIKTILIISKLFNQLLDIYKYKFSNNLIQLLVPNIDIIKINLFKKVILETIKNPKYIIQLQNDFLKEHLILYHSKSDNYSKAICLLLNKYWSKILDSITNIESRDKRKLIFYFNNWLNLLTKQKNLFINFKLDPINIKTINNNFLNSIKNCLLDLIMNHGYIDIQFNNNDPAAFSVGKNLAASKGKVIYKNDLMELIQYYPTTLNIFKAPLLFIPPCINKYYILDLSTNNSLVQWLLTQGFAVYMISWVNPDTSFANKTFSDYLTNGPLKAIDVITEITPSNTVHLAGYCMGGTMLSCILSYMQKTNNPKILSATHFMSLLDFSNFKDLNEDSLNKLEKSTNKTGYLNGRLLSMAFNIVHANELIWPYFINYYLLNKSLATFDTLYWNCDAINLPTAMYNFYLRTICFKNQLCEPNAIKINGVSIDLSKVTVPIFYLAGGQDRISPWEIAYKSLQLYSSSSNKQFVLAAAGHVTGLINPPTDNQSSYKILNEPKTNNFTKYPGSWWPYWLNWLTNIDSDKIEATELNAQAISNAPGNYVLKKITKTNNT